MMKFVLPARNPFVQFFENRFLKKRKGGLILLYHRVADSDFDPLMLSVKKRVFEEQMLWLKKNCNILPLSELVLSGGVSERAVSVTFDDGYADNYYNVLPIVEKLGITISIFVSVGYLGKKKFFWDNGAGDSLCRPLTLSELVNLSKSKCVELGSHTISHFHLPIISYSILRREIIGSKKMLEDIIGRSVYSFSYPFGSYLEIDRKSFKLVSENYSFACANFEGKVFSFTSRFLLPRLVVRNCPLDIFTIRLESWL